MDLPATQAFEDEDFPSTQGIPTNDSEEKTLVGSLVIGEKSHPVFSRVITTIGRHPANKIVIDNDVINHVTVSKNHAEIEAGSGDGNIFIRDLRSCNGTKINDTKLGPLKSYQVKDGDKLTFGQVIAKFKQFHALDDSVVIPTPQVNRKVRPIIPGTPDSSMNSSSASEGDISVIPGTQTEANDNCFRRPQLPVRASTSNEHKSPKLPAFNVDDLPSPLSKNKSKQDDISEVETQRFSTSNVNDDLDSSIYSAETQKAGSSNKCNDYDENIYEMETQRPYNPEDDIENLQTQRCDVRKSDINRKSDIYNDISVHSASTKKVVTETPIDEVIENLETQRFDCKRSDSNKNESMDVSIYSASTQKLVLENESFENLETQQFNVRKSDKFQTSNTSNRKSCNVSIYSAPTQKLVPETSNSESIENLETQQFDIRKFNHIQTPNASNRKSCNVSIYSAPTQKLVPETTNNESIENLETQQFDVREPNKFQTPTLPNRKSHNILNRNSEIRKINLETSINESIENLETQKFNYQNLDSSAKESNKSIHEVETQKIVPERFVDESIQNLETQKFHDSTSSKIILGEEKNVLDTKDNESLDDLETQEFITKNTSAIINESVDIETQQFDKSAGMVSSMSFTLEDMETVSYIEERLPLNNDIQNVDTQKPEQLSSDSGFRSLERESQQNKSNYLENDQKDSNLELNKPSRPLSSHKVDKFKSINDEVTKNLQKDNSMCSETLKNHDVSKNVSIHNIELAKSMMEEDDDDEMFCSQALIDDNCPFAYIPEELPSDNDKSVTEHKQSEKNESNISIDTKNTNLGKQETSLKRNQVIAASDDDAETDEEGIFTSHQFEKNGVCESSIKTIVKDNNKTLNKKENEDDSETDEECVFSNSLPKESKSNISITKTKVSKDVEEKIHNKNDGSSLEINKEVTVSNNLDMKEIDVKNKNDSKALCNEVNEDDSETDEEGVFSNSLPKECGSNESVSKTKDGDKINYEDNGTNSDTNEEGIVSNNLTEQGISKKANAINNKNDIKALSDQVNEGDSETDEEGIYLSHLSEDHESEQLNIKNKQIDIETEKELVSNKSFNNSLSKRKSLSLKQKNIICPKSPTPESDDNLFDEFYEEKRNTGKLQEIDDSKEVENVDKTSTNICAENEVDELAPTQVVETENTNVAPAQKLNTDIRESVIPDIQKNSHYIDDLAPTQIVETERIAIDNLAPTQVVETERIAIDDLEPTQVVETERIAIDDLAPTQIIETEKISIDDQEDEFLAPTQVVNTMKRDSITEQVLTKEKNFVGKSVELFNNINLAPTQKMNDIEQCDESLQPTQKVSDTQQCSESLQLTLKVSDTQPCTESLQLVLQSSERLSSQKSTESMHLILQDTETQQLTENQNIDYETAPAQVVNQTESMVLNSSKRLLEEIEITSSKKSKIQNDSQNDKIDLNKTVEKNLDEMFEGPKEVLLNEQKSVLQTQQLESILESSQIEDNINLNTSSIPSPTLSTRRSRAKGKLRKPGNKCTPPDTKKQSTINLNDTIERNLNEMFDNSVNTVDSFESDIMATQQLTNVLESQENNQSEKEKSLNLSSNVTKRKHRLSLNHSVSSISKNQEKKQISKSLNVQSTDVDSNDNTSQEGNLKEESQDTQEYFHNLKSKKKRNVIDDSQSDEEMKQESSSGNNKNVVYRRGIKGFSDKSTVVSTEERVEFLVTTGRSFTSDSQSDGEEIFHNNVMTPSRASGKKRFNLSLSKNMNASISSSSSDQEMLEKKLPLKLQKSSEKSLSSSTKKSGNIDPKLLRKSSVPIVSIKRIQAPGTRGFTNDREPVDSEEIVSAASTECEDDFRSDKVSNQHHDSKKVITTQTSKISGLTIVRSKRIADDTQNQPLKRTKTNDDNNHSELQKLSPADLPALGKRVVKAPKTLDTYVVPQNPRSRLNSSGGSVIDSSIVEDKDKNANKNNTRSTRGKANNKKDKVDSSIVHSNSSSKENLMDDSDAESVTEISKTRSDRPKRNQITESSVIKDSSKDEVNSSTDDKSTTKMKGRATRNQKKDVPVKKDIKANKEIPVIQDSDTEQNEKSEIINKNTRSRRIKNSDSEKSEITHSSIENESLKTTRSRVTRRNQKKEIIQDSDSSQVSQEHSEESKSEKSEITDSSVENKNSKTTRGRATRRNQKKEIIQDSDSSQASQKNSTTSNKKDSEKVKEIITSDSQKVDKSEIINSSIENENSRNTRGRVTRRNQKKEIPVKEPVILKKEFTVIEDSDSDGSEFVNKKSEQIKDTHNLKLKESNNSEISNKSTENESINNTKARTTRRNQKKDKPVSKNVKTKEISETENSEDSESAEKKTKGKDATENSQKPDIIKKDTKTRRGKPRDQSPDSLFSESDNDKEKNSSLANKSSRSQRQTRKRPAVSDTNVTETIPSIESQEVIEILKNAENNSENNKTRSCRAVKRINTLNSDDTQSSQDDKCNNDDDTFEKPVSRPKRARLNKSSKNQSTIEKYLNVTEDSKMNSLQNSSISQRKKTPSPTPSSKLAPSPASTLTPSRSSRRSISISPMKGASHRVLFTGEKSEVHRQIVAKLGGSEIEDPAKCSILVTDKVRRTFKFLCSLARGIPIVSVNWLDDSKKAHHFLDWEDYILKDPAAEAKFKFNLKTSLEKAKTHKLLEGYNVLLAPHITQPPVSELKEMVISSGGKHLLRAPAKWPENTVIIVKEDNLKSARQLITKAPKSVTIHSTEFILTGILRQEINLQEFKISV